MSKGYSLHIGVNKTDPAHYSNLPALGACVNDAKYWRSYAQKMGYEVMRLYDSQATSKAVLDALKAYAAKAKPG